MDMAKMMKQAKALQEEMAQVQKRIDALEVEGSASGGAVTLILTGQGRLKQVRIQPTLLSDGDCEMLEDLILAAHNDAWVKLEQRKEAEMGSGMMGKMPKNFLI